MLFALLWLSNTAHDLAEKTNLHNHVFVFFAPCNALVNLKSYVEPYRKIIPVCPHQQLKLSRRN